MIESVAGQAAGNHARQRQALPFRCELWVCGHLGRKKLLVRLDAFRPVARYICHMTHDRPRLINVQEYRRTWKALLRVGEDVGRDRVKRSMRLHGIQGAKRRGKPWRTTQPSFSLYSAATLSQCPATSSAIVDMPLPRSHSSPRSHRVRILIRQWYTTVSVPARASPTDSACPQASYSSASSTSPSRPGYAGEAGPPAVAHPNQRPRVAYGSGAQPALLLQHMHPEARQPQNDIGKQH